MYTVKGTDVSRKENFYTAMKYITNPRILGKYQNWPCDFRNRDIKLGQNIFCC